MDVLYSIATGLGVRVFLQGVQEPLGRLTLAILGLWEGAAIHHFSNSNPSDQYLAYALRVAVDFYFTESLERAFIVFLWTVLGLLALESLNPARPRRERRRRTSRSLPAARVRRQPSTTPPQTSEIPREATRTPYVRSVPAPSPTETTETPPPAQTPVPASTPAVRPSRPATPPSFFLEGESDSSSPNPRYLPSVFSEGEGDSGSPPPKPVLLPTPSTTTKSEGRDTHGPGSERRLSTIEEHSIEGLSSADEGSQYSYLVPGGHRRFTRTIPSYAPSVATTVPPLPVPNSTIQYIHTSVSRASPAELEYDEAEDAYAPSAVPLPVPNAGTYYRPGTLSDGGDGDGDPLQTPNAGHWELTDNDADPLTTPPAMYGKELSPLVLGHNIYPAFGTAVGSMSPSGLPSAPEPIVILTRTPTRPAAEETVPAPKNVSASAIATSSTSAQAQAVEYSSPRVAPDAPAIHDDPDLAAADSSGDPDPEPKSSYPTPDPSPSPNRGEPPTSTSTRTRTDQRTSNSNHDNDDHDPAPAPDPELVRALLEAETETETDAASVISPRPARLMYAHAEDVRDKARAADARCQELHLKLARATNEGRVRDVLFLKEEVRVEEARAARLHERAARRFVVARNPSEDLQTVDVHGLRKAEAIRITEKALRDALTHGYPSVRVIVGKGLHSVNGIPVLKEAVTKAMAAYVFTPVHDSEVLIGR